MRGATALAALLASTAAAFSQTYPIVVPNTGASPPATPAGIQQLISGTPWINGVGGVGGRNWRDNYQIIHDTIATLGTWNSQGAFSLNPMAFPLIVGDLACTPSTANVSCKVVATIPTPAPTQTTLGGILQSSAPTHQFMMGVSPTGVLQYGQPGAGDVSGLAPSATIDATNAANIVSGTLAGGRLPAPTSSIFGGILAAAAPAHQFETGNAAGVPAFAQPQFGDVGGTAQLSQGGTGATTAAAALVALGAANKAGDTITGPWLFNQTLGLPSVPSSQDLTYALTPTAMANVLKFGPGNSISIAPPLSCLSTSPRCGSAPTNDHQRTSALISGTTLVDNAAEEQTLAIVGTIQTGARTNWTANTSYASLANVASYGQVYRQTSGAPCTSGTVTAPLGTGTQVADNTCAWTWINSSVIATKVGGAYIETAALAGAGFSEGLVTNFGMQGAGFGGPFDPTQGAVGIEHDFSNNAGTDCPIFKCTGVTLNTSGTGVISTALYLDGSGGTSAANTSGAAGRPTAQHGFRISHSQASNDDIDIADSAAIGLLIENDPGKPGLQSHSDSAIKDTSSAGTGYNQAGSYTNGIALGGSYGGAQIVGQGNFVLYPDGSLKVGNANASTSPSTGALQIPSGGLGVGGNISGGANGNFVGQVKGATLKVTPVTVATLPTCNSAAEGTFAAITDAASPTYNGTLTGGGTSHVPAYCNGTAWTAH